MTAQLAQMLAQRLNAAGYGEREGLLAQWSQQLGLSRSTLLRHAKRHGYQPQERKARDDAGQSRAGITDEGLAYVVALMTGSHRKTGVVEMPTTEAVDECCRRGVLPTGTNVETVRRLLRQRGLSRRALQANYTTDGQTVSSGHARMQSAGPNALHEVDVSACLHWYFKKRGGLAFRHKQLDLAGGKKAEPYRQIKDHILRYVLVDHNTGAFFIWYYFAAGETSLNLLDFLYNAWRRREHPHDIFHGAPQALYFDMGAANTSQITSRLLDHLRVPWTAHQAGNSRATGMAEVYQRIWQAHFESKLWLRPPEDLEELNARAEADRIHYCATHVNSGTGKTRWDAWSAIRPGDLRIIPPREVFNELVYEKPHRTKARGDGIVRYKGGQHLILEPINVGQPLEVLRNPYRLPELLIFRVNADGERGELLQTKAISGPEDYAVAVGEFKRRPDSPAQRAMKLAGELDLEPFAETVFSARVEELPENVRWLERRGEEIAVEPPAAPPRDEAEDSLERPAWFGSGTERYEWSLRHQAAGGELTQADLAWMSEFEASPEYNDQLEWWDQLRRWLAQEAQGGRA